MSSPDSSSTNIEFLARNFGAISAVFTALAAILSMIFLLGYLSIFDPFLILTIEYGDLFKFIIIGVSILFFLLAASITIMDAFLAFRTQNAHSMTYAIVIACVVIFYAIYPAVSAYYAKNDSLAYEAAKIIPILTAALFLFVLLTNPYLLWPRTVSQCFRIIISVGGFVWLVGIAYGVYVRDEALPHLITIKQPDESTRMIANAHLILFTSHHVIVYFSGTVVIIQTSDIIEIRVSPFLPPGAVTTPNLLIP